MKSPTKFISGASFKFKLGYLFKVFSGSLCLRSIVSTLCIQTTQNTWWSAISHVPLLGQFLHPASV